MGAGQDLCDRCDYGTRRECCASSLTSCNADEEGNRIEVELGRGKKEKKKKSNVCIDMLMVQTNATNDKGRKQCTK